MTVEFYVTGSPHLSSPLIDNIILGHFLNSAIMNDVSLIRSSALEDNFFRHGPDPIRQIVRDKIPKILHLIELQPQLG